MINSPLTIIICGLSGSGKSTLGKGVYDFLVRNQIPAELMDADTYRKVLSPNEPFDEKTRDIFRNKLFFVAKLLNKNGINAVIITANVIKNDVRSKYDFGIGCGWRNQSIVFTSWHDS